MKYKVKLKLDDLYLIGIKYLLYEDGEYYIFLIK